MWAEFQRRVFAKTPYIIIANNLSKVSLMSILVRFSSPSMRAKPYDAILERLHKEGVHIELRIEIRRNS